MADKGPSRADDMQVLRILSDLTHGHGMSAEKVGRKHGLTRGVISGIRFRTLTASDKIGCKCVKPENKTGGMPFEWWAR